MSREGHRGLRRRRAHFKGEEQRMVFCTAYDLDERGLRLFGLKLWVSQGLSSKHTPTETQRKLQRRNADRYFCRMGSRPSRATTGGGQASDHHSSSCNGGPLMGRDEGLNVSKGRLHRKRCHLLVVLRQPLRVTRPCVAIACDDDALGVQDPMGITCPACSVPSMISFIVGHVWRF